MLPHLCFWCKGTSWGVGNTLYVVLLVSAPIPSTLLITPVSTSKKLQQASETIQACQLGAGTRHYQDNQLQFLSYTKSCFPSSPTTTQKNGNIKKKDGSSWQFAFKKSPSPCSTNTQNASLSLLILLHTTRINDWWQLPVAENSSFSFELIFHVLSLS